MSLLGFEHSNTAYLADYLIYGSAVTLLTGFLVIGEPPARLLEDSCLAVSGLAIWTIVEYGLHRYVLHGVQPFMNWHIEHHSRPKALIGSPTILSAGLIISLVFLPALFLSNTREASALTLGVLIGYLIYSITHHAVHHWQAESAWLKQRRRAHTVHHHSKDRPGRYGVTTDFWDRIFGTDGDSGDKGKKRVTTNGTYIYSSKSHPSPDIQTALPLALTGSPSEILITCATETPNLRKSARRNGPHEYTSFLDLAYFRFDLSYRRIFRERPSILLGWNLGADRRRCRVEGLR